MNVILKYEADIRKAENELAKLVGKKEAAAAPAEEAAATPAKKGALH